MRRWPRYLIIGVCAYVLFTLLTIPAALVYGWTRDLVPGLNAYGIQGSLWSGRAELVTYQSVRIPGLQWSLRPTALLLGRLESAWEVDSSEMRGRGNAGRNLLGTVYFSDTTAQVPVQTLQALLPYRLPLALAGTASLQIDRLRLDAGRPEEVEGTIDLQGAALQAPKLDLGDFHVTLATESDGIKATVADHGGPLETQGIATVTSDGSYRFDATLSARDTSQPALAQYLRMLGQPGPDGRVKISTSGQL